MGMVSAWRDRGRATAKAEKAPGRWRAPKRPGVAIAGGAKRVTRALIKAGREEAEAGEGRGPGVGGYWVVEAALEVRQWRGRGDFEALVRWRGEWPDSWIAARQLTPALREEARALRGGGIRRRQAGAAVVWRRPEGFRRSPRLRELVGEASEDDERVRGGKRQRRPAAVVMSESEESADG